MVVAGWLPDCISCVAFDTGTWVGDPARGGVDTPPTLTVCHAYLTYLARIAVSQLAAARMAAAVKSVLNVQYCVSVMPRRKWQITPVPRMIAG